MAGEATGHESEGGRPLAELVEEHRGLVEGLCRRLDREPEDCAQEIWEKVLRGLERYNPARGGVRAWLAAIARRHIIDRHRRRVVREEVVTFGDAAVRDPEGVVDLERALQQLPIEQRRVVLFHHHQGVSLAELAELEGVAIGTVKSRLHRARARLVHLLEGSDER